MEGTEKSQTIKKQLKEEKQFKEHLMAMGYGEQAVDAILFGENKGLWHNIHEKRKRIKNGSGERMRKPGSKGAPSASDLKDAGKDEK